MGPVFIMRTISRHQRVYGDFRGTCDYCGVEWMRSKMQRDAAGLLACPDDLDGKDMVTLSLENAAGASDQQMVPLRDGANTDQGGEDYLLTPLSIMDTVQGWWQPKQSGTILASGFGWIPNVRQFSEGGEVGVRRGSVSQADPDFQPAFANDQVVFTSDFLRSLRGKMTAADSNPTVWMVGSFTASGGMFGLQGAGDIPITEGVAVPPVIQLGYDSTTGLVRADTTYEGNFGGSGNGTFLSTSQPLPDANLHLFVITQTTTEIRLQIDGGDVSATLASTQGTITGTGTPTVFDRVNYGQRSPILVADLGFATTHTGRLEEVVVADTIATDDELTAMRTYFKAQYPELP